MTEKEKIAMYMSLCAGDKWERKCDGNRSCSSCEVGLSCTDSEWAPFNLGDKFDNDGWEYRKVEKYHVIGLLKFENDKKSFKQDSYLAISDEEYNYRPNRWTSYGIVKTFSSLYAANEWISRNKKTWLEIQVDGYDDATGFYDGAVCAFKRVLELAEKNKSTISERDGDYYVIDILKLKELIKEQGVKL